MILYILFEMVPGEGIEPSLPCGNRILNPARLPIPPSGQLGSRLFDTLPTDEIFGKSFVRWCAICGLMKGRLNNPFRKMVLGWAKPYADLLLIS